MFSEPSRLYIYWENNMNELVSKYIYALKAKNLSKNTIDAYNSDLNFFVDFLDKHNEDLKGIDEMTIMAYVQYLKKIGRANSSIVRSTVSIRRFYKYLLRQDIVCKDPIIKYESVKSDKRTIPQILTVEEVDKLLSMPDVSTNKGKRDKAMLEVMYGTGLKVSELINLTMKDINIKLSYLRCSGSRRRERIIPFGSYAIRCLETYFEIRDKINMFKLNYVFLNMRGTAMSRQGLWKIVKFYVNEAKIDKPITPNTLRHSFAVHLLQNGADIKSIQELLGYSDIAAAEVYYNVSKKSKLYEVYKKSHPRA